MRWPMHVNSAQNAAMLVLLLLYGMMLVSPVAGQTREAGKQVTDAERIQWFEHDKFGMFIHWGPYSYLAGEWKGRRIPVGD